MISVKLTQTAEYALRAMSALALVENNEVVASDELSKYAEIPSHYLSKIMKQLVDAKLVESIKGHGGGFRIIKPLKEIKFIDILSAASYGHEPNKCVFGENKCNPLKPCILHNCWSELNDDFKGWSNTKTLWHVKREGEKLGKIFPEKIKKEG